MAKSKRPRRDESSQPAARNSRTTVSGPAAARAAGAAVDVLAAKLVGTDELAVSLPFNPIKPSEYEPRVLEGPDQGPSVTPRDPIVGASTVSERNSSDKVGTGGPIIGVNKIIAPLDRVRVDSSKRVLTTNQVHSGRDEVSGLHAAKPEPHFGVPQAASAHDTFWDFADLHERAWVPRQPFNVHKIKESRHG